MRRGGHLKSCPSGWHRLRLQSRLLPSSGPAGPVPVRIAQPVSTTTETTTSSSTCTVASASSAGGPVLQESSVAVSPVLLELPPATLPSEVDLLQSSPTSSTDPGQQYGGDVTVAVAVANNVVQAPGMNAVPVVPVVRTTSETRSAASLTGTGTGALTSDPAAAPSVAEDEGNPVEQQRAPSEPFTLASSSLLAGGKMDLVHWREGRMLRIWTPPGFSLSDAAREPYPVVYLNDGQNLFDDRLTLSGHAWHAAEAAAGLINSGALPPFVIVGVDHSGDTRPYDYLPYKPGDANGARPDAAEWPGGGVDAYLRAVVDEILPYAERTYGVSNDPSLRIFGGSSFGGICALCAALRCPGVFGSLLVESPSLWFADEKLLRHDLPDFTGPWPSRIFLAMGTKEYSGIRKKTPNPDFDDQLVVYARELAQLLESRGLVPGQRLQLVVEEGATHTESAWAGRLPAALGFLGLPWWRRFMARRRDQLYFTVPRKLRAGQPAVLFFNQARSAVLADSPRSSIKVAYGFNVDWCVGGGRTDMVPAVGLTALQKEMLAAVAGTGPAPSSLSSSSSSGVAAATTTAAAAAVAAAGPLAAMELPTEADEADEELAAPAAPDAGEEVAAAVAAATLPPAYDIIGDVTDDFDPSSASQWLQATFTVPPEAYEMHLAFNDGPGGNWDNNAGSNFYIRVKMDMTAEQRSHTVDQALMEGPAWGDVQEIAHKRIGSAFFTTPEVLVAGEPAVLYVNRRRVRGLEFNPNLRLHFGFNGWQAGSQEAYMKPTSLWRGEHVDWWSATLTVPTDATDLSFVLTDGHGIWDNNSGNNYVSPVKRARAVGTSKRAQPRAVEAVESMPHAAGTLHIVQLTKRRGGGSAVRTSKWTEEKRLRVWTPPGFDAARPPPGGYPVLFMQDGQNMFEDWLAHQGVSWRVGYTASELISRGELPPFVVVAVDSAGAMRSLNYLPYPPGTGQGGFRGDAERWPGGGLEAYMTRLVEEIMPLVQERFAVSSDPAKVAFGGGSFAGVAALYAAMHYPHVFGCVLAESPSLWIAEGRFLQDMRMHRGMLPERLFLGCGTREYSATRDHDREDVDALLLSYCQEAATIMESQGLRGGRLRFLVEEGAGHHELAWQWRLTGAMRFLFNAWWDE